MLASVLCGVLLQLPVSNPPALECSSTFRLDPSPTILFAPQFGGLPINAGAWKERPDSGLAVHPVSGVLFYYSPMDYEAPTREAIRPLFARLFRSDLLALGWHSPGFPAGWVHNYDLKIQESKVDFPLKLIYPNGAFQQMTPKTDKNGALTGEIEVARKDVFTCSATRDPETRDWSQIKVLWPNCQWVFERSSASLFRLTRIEEADGTPALEFKYDSLGRLQHVVQDKKLMLSLIYGKQGYLDALADQQRVVTFGYRELEDSGLVQLVLAARLGPQKRLLALHEYGYERLANRWVLSGVAVATQDADAPIRVGISYDEFFRVSGLSGDRGVRFQPEYPGG